MARKVINKKNFLIIKISIEEARELGFGIEGHCICTECNKFIDGDIYYVCVLNDTMDKECLLRFLARATRYVEDMDIEKRYYNIYAPLLDIE